MTNSQEAKVFDFDVIWRYLPVNRPKKELLKSLLFHVFKPLFKNWAIYQNWSHARVFHPGNLSSDPQYLSKTLLRRFYQTVFAKKAASPARIEKLAIVIHAFYPDVLAEILAMIGQNSKHGLKLFVSTTAQNHSQIEILLEAAGMHYKLLTVENKGRDMLPFLMMLPHVKAEGFDLVLKLHTKKSNHLNRPARWSADLFNKLLGVGIIDRTWKTFELYPDIGIIGPEGHILPMWLYYGANARNVKSLASKSVVDAALMRGLLFPAGSMFYARMEVLEPLLQLSLSASDFEPEAGQKDGTLAHALERFIPLLARKGGYVLADTAFDAQHQKMLIVKNHYFTL